MSRNSYIQIIDIKIMSDVAQTMDDRMGPINLLKLLVHAWNIKTNLSAVS